MSLSKETPSPTTPEASLLNGNPFVRSREIGDATPPVIRADAAERRIHELPQVLFAESKREMSKTSPQEKALRKDDGFEPFVNPQPPENALFVNGYTENFAQRMELNRKGIERVLKIARLDGQVFLTSLSPNRQRSIDVNPDGSVTGKRSLFFWEKIERDQEKDQSCRVTPIPEGWKIEINDGKIMGDLTEKGLTGEKRRKVFTKRFNGLLNKSLLECIRREKLSDEKDKAFMHKMFQSLLPIPYLILFSVSGLMEHSLYVVPYMVGTAILCYGIINSTGLFTSTFRSGKYSPFRQKFDNFWEYFAPQVEIDKAARAWAFLSLKGRTLARETKQESK